MEEIKKKLLEMQEVIVRDYEQENNLSKASATRDTGDNIDHAYEERERELHQLFCERDRVKLKQIRKALIRIDKDEYGTCEDCETTIRKSRLLALPFTRLCISCKTEEEKTNGRSGIYEDSSNLGIMEKEQD